MLIVQYLHDNIGFPYGQFNKIVFISCFLNVRCSTNVFPDIINFNFTFCILVYSKFFKKIKSEIDRVRHSEKFIADSCG